MKKGDITFLLQAVTSLEQASKKIEESYSAKDEEKFNSTKKIMLILQGEMERVLNE